jgi:hypothetical protein
MKTTSIISAVLLFCGTVLTQQTEQKPYDITLRDDQEPVTVSFQTKNRDFAVMSCGEYGFGATAGAKIETVGCTTQITFDFLWRGRKEFSFHPRKKSHVTITIKVGDNLHGEFIVDNCAKTASGFIRDDNQNLALMNLSDTDVTDSKGYCGGPPDYNKILVPQ